MSLPVLVNLCIDSLRLTIGVYVGLPVIFKLLTDVCWWDSFGTLYLLKFCLFNFTDTLEFRCVFCFCKNVETFLMAFHWFQVLLEVDFNKLSSMF